MSRTSGYSHTQRGIIFPILLATTVFCLAFTWTCRNGPLPTLLACAAGAALCLLLAFAFVCLTVSDEGDRLAVRFGPLPLFRKTIPYAKITGAERDRSTFLAGWGIHYTRKGWLWNIGGFDCVRIEMGTRSTLIGTDNPDGLVAFLRTKTQPAHSHHVTA